MSTQSAYDKEVAKIRAQEQALSNQRTTEQDAKKKSENLKNLNDSLTALERNIIGPAIVEIDAAEKAMKPLKDAVVAYRTANPTATPSTDPTLAALYSQIAPLEAQKTAAQKRRKDAEQTKDSIKKQISDLNKSSQTYTKDTSTDKSTTNSTSSNAPRGQKIKFSKDYKYNAPMISSAYFGRSGFETSVLEGNLVDGGKSGDAREAWKGTTGGRGTIQMDKKFLSAFTSSTQNQTKVKIDTQKYGFKFLYNPQTVQMAWGLLNYMSPPFEAMAQDAFQVVSAGLMPSIVSFELLLNRVQDFDYINETGLKTKTSTFVGENSGPGVNNPYPTPVPNQDLVEIYNKGTMYDLEYLLRTLNGPDGTFTSMLNGTTADRGWLRPTIVELHLGNSLRYRVRISEFSVNHIMFNPRMVPILSSVKLTCNRFADGPDTEFYGPSNIAGPGGGSKTPSSGLKNLQNSVPGYGR